MGLTVEKAMKIGGLKKSKVISGFGGLDNIIDFISVIEVPDAELWFRGNELLLTAFYNIGNDSNIQLNLLKKMKAKNVSALGVCYPGRYYQEYHPDFLELANKFRIPIIEVPDDVAYIDIISPLTKKIHNNYSDYILTLQKLFLEWTNSRINLQKLTDLLSQYINCPVAITDKKFNLLTITSNSYNKKKAIINWIANNNSSIDIKEVFIHSLEKDYLFIVPIQLKNELLGFLITLSKDKNIDDFLLNTISTNLSIYLSHPNSNNKNIYQQKLINEWLISNNLSTYDIKNFAREINWDIDSTVGIALIKSKNTSFIKTLKEKLTSLQWFKVDNYQVLFIKDNTKSEDLTILYDLVKSIQDSKKITSISYYIHKNNGEFITNANKFYSILIKSITLQLNIPNLPQIINIDHFPIFTLINQENFNPNRFLELINPLLVYDEQYDADLYLTLEYLLFFSNIQEICKHLNIHRNTLNYRRQKIIDILNENPINSLNIAQYQIAAYCKYIF